MVSAGIPRPKPTANAGKVPGTKEEYQSFPRVASYLPARPVRKSGAKKASESWIHSAIMAFSGKFLKLGDEEIVGKGSIAGVTANLQNEAVNMGLMSALMLTMVTPMLYENVSDWLEEDYHGGGMDLEGGYLGQHLTGDWRPALNDSAMILYLVGFVGFLWSSIVSVFIILCSGELQSDAATAVFLQHIGSASRMPYLFFMFGCLFSVATVVRMMLSIKTLGGLVFLCVFMATVAAIISWLCVFMVRCQLKAFNAVQGWEDLSLTQAEAKADVEKWVEKNPGGGTLQHCLEDLSARAPPPSNGFIPLSGVSEKRVAIHFHRLHAQELGIKLSDFELYSLSEQRL